MLISVAMRSGGVSSSLQDSEFWGGLEEKEFHIVFLRGSFLAERGPRVPVILDIHHFGGLVTMRLRRMAVCIDMQYPETFMRRLLEVLNHMAGLG